MCVDTSTYIQSIPVLEYVSGSKYQLSDQALLRASHVLALFIKEFRMNVTGYSETMEFNSGHWIALDLSHFCSVCPTVSQVRLTSQYCCR